MYIYVYICIYICICTTTTELLKDTQYLSWEYLLLCHAAERSPLAKTNLRAGEADIARQVDSVAAGVLGLFTRHWTNEIKTQTDCKPVSASTWHFVHAQRIGTGSHWIQTEQEPWQGADSGWTIESPRNVAFLLYALSHTGSHKHILTPCSLWDWKKNGTEPWFALRSTISQAACRIPKCQFQSSFACCH